MGTTYIQFGESDDQRILVEVDALETEEEGIVRAGLRDKIQDSVATAQSSLQAALGQIISTNAHALLAAVADLDSRPTQMELTFGVKATRELGNFTVAKAGAEANYTIRLVWQAQ